MAVARTGQSLLKRAALSRPSGEWNDDDFDVLAAGIVVGRIMKAAAAPGGLPTASRMLPTAGPGKRSRRKCPCNGAYLGSSRPILPVDRSSSPSARWLLFVVNGLSNIGSRRIRKASRALSMPDMASRALHTTW